MDFTHGEAVPVAVMMVEQPASNRGPMRKQHDFFAFMVISNNVNSLSLAVNNLCRSESDGDHIMKNHKVVHAINSMIDSVI
jgi:hypothetical protein